MSMPEALNEDALRARNLNRLRRGKMMLDYGRRKKSALLTFALTFTLGFLGIHRFYLGQPWVGAAFLSNSLAAIALGHFVPEHPATTPIALAITMAVLVELALAPFWAGTVNKRLRRELEAKYNVEPL